MARKKKTNAKKTTQSDQRLQDKIVELCADGQWHSIDAIVERILPFTDQEENVAAFYEGLGEGKKYGRRWAKDSAGAEERERLQRLQDTCGGKWFAWLDSCPDVAPMDLFFGALHPDKQGDMEVANAWWKDATDANVVRLLEMGDSLIIAGFAMGAIEEWSTGTTSDPTGAQGRDKDKEA